MPEQIAESDVVSFLRDLHAGEGEVTGLETLSGGYWSAAYGYRVGERELVLRLGQVREGFEMDRAAIAFAGDGLPIPEVLDIGDALGRSYAVSVRHHGRFLESARPSDAGPVGDALVGLLRALLAVPAAPGAAVAWFHETGDSWRESVLDALVDDPSRTVSGWRAMLAAEPVLDQLFRSCEERIADLLSVVPERRDLVHGDLLHANVLVADDFSDVNAVFSWKCSMRGDFLYDLALCTFWTPWHDGIGAASPFPRLLRSLLEDPPTDASDDLLADASLRHHCYELQIGAHHLGWYAWNDDAENQGRLVQHLTAVLERGPLDLPG